jgi:hypothetical protein
MCVAVASDMRPQSEASAIPGDGDTFVFSLEVPSRIAARRLGDSLVDVFGSPVRAIPAPLAKQVWKMVASPDVNGRLAYSISTGSHQNQLQALRQVSFDAVAGSLRIVASGDNPSTVTQSLDLRKEGLYVLLLDVSLDHDDIGQVFYGRPPQDFIEEDSTAFSLFKGRNLVGIPLSSRETLQRIRFDPGHRPGSYILAGFSIKGVPADAVLRRRE